MIDECLSVELAAAAHRRGFAASHLRDLGLLGRRDGQVFQSILDGDWCFVTRNARDFRGSDKAPGSGGLYAGAPLHAGLICLHGPAALFTLNVQPAAFDAALDALRDDCGGDPVNTLIEATWSSGGIQIEIFGLPSS